MFKKCLIGLGCAIPTIALGALVYYSSEFLSDGHYPDPALNQPEIIIPAKQPEKKYQKNPYKDIEQRVKQIAETLSSGFIDQAFKYSYKSSGFVTAIYYSTNPRGRRSTNGTHLEMLYQEKSLHKLIFTNIDTEKHEAQAFEVQRMISRSDYPVYSVELIEQDKDGIKFIIYSGKRYCKIQESPILGPDSVNLACSITAESVSDPRGENTDEKSVKDLVDIIEGFEKNYGINAGIEDIKKVLLLSSLTPFHIIK